jgi:hypothetical protein
MINWEQLKSEPPWVNAYRAKVPKGWLIFTYDASLQNFGFNPSSNIL